MGGRVVALVLGIVLYSGIAISASSVALPAAGLNGFAALDATSRSLGIQTGSTSTETAGERDRDRGWLGSANFFQVWLRPFGVHRPGVSDLIWTAGSFAVLGTAGTILLFLFPKRVRYAANVLRAAPISNHLLNGLLGLMAYLVGYAVLRLSWLTIVGAPFIPFLIGGVWLATMMGIVAVSFAIGRALFRRFDVRLPVLGQALIGLWLLFVTGMVPYVGWAAAGCAAAVGFGLLLQTRFGSRQGWSLESLEDPLELPEPDSKIVQLRKAR